MAEGFLGQIRRLRGLGFSTASQAVGGTTQALASPLAQTVTLATGQNGTAAYIIPATAATQGAGIFVVINTSASAVPVFPNVGSAFNGGSANASVSIAANKTGTFYIGSATAIGYVISA